MMIYIYCYIHKLDTCQASSVIIFYFIIYGIFTYYPVLFTFCLSLPKYYDGDIVLGLLAEEEKDESFIIGAITFYTQ